MYVQQHLRLWLIIDYNIEQINSEVENNETEMGLYTRIGQQVEEGLGLHRVVDQEHIAKRKEEEEEFCKKAEHLRETH